VVDLQTRLEAAERIADESERQLRVMSSHNENDGGRVAALEKALKAAQVLAARSLDLFRITMEH
jgi:hypothetical protein